MTQSPIRKLLLACMFLGVWGGAFYCLLRFSPYGELEVFLRRPVSVRFFDRNGALVQITPVEGGLRREYRKLAELPPELAAVFVFAEDRRFYSHFGIDPPAVLRALVQNIRQGRRVSGASTITMQLARLIASYDAARQGRGPAGLIRKAAEAWNALRLEARLSKEAILELYLNSLPFGFQTEGTASAARNFFALDPAMLSPAQMFCLAVIPRRPGAYNPLTGKEACRIAAEALYRRFVQAGHGKSPFPAPISPGDWNFALEQARRFDYPFRAPHFVRFVQGELRREAAEGTRPGARPEYSLSIDLSLQRHLEGLIAGNVSRHYRSRLTNGAALALDNKTGEILAWVGSADYYNAEAAGQVDGVLAANQPGSAMKPFLYALALERGFRPTDVLADVPMNFGTERLYVPQNFNNRFNGPMLFRAALASSLNIPAVYLLYRLGVENYTRYLLSLGFDSLAYIPDKGESGPGLGLALGNAPVSVFELARAFSVFPRDGLLIPLRWEKAGETEAGEGQGAGLRVMEKDAARIICSFLSDRSARMLAFGQAPNFSAPFPVIFKTGTANQYQNIVALAASEAYTAAVWMGNFTGETVIGRTGSSIPAAIARDSLVFLHGSQGGDFREPENFSRQRICALSGMAPAADCPSTVTEYTAPDEVLEACTWHRRSVTVYPAEYQAWFLASTRQGTVDHSAAALEILTPRNNFVYLTSPGGGLQEIPVEVIGGGEEELVIDYGGASWAIPRPFRFFLPPEPGSHRLSVRNGEERAEVVFRVE